MVEIGKKIKQYRRQLALTQEELAQRTELTKGYISQLENDLCSPSIATLQDILSVLGVSLQDFFAEEKLEKVVYTQADYFVSESANGRLTWLIPNSQVKQMEPIVLTLSEGQQSIERYPFEGEEFGYVLSGAVDVVCGSNRYRVKKGETFSLDGKTQHIIQNAKQGASTVLWVTTPSNF